MMIREQWIKIRVSDEEKTAWTQKARAAGLPLSELIRQSLDRAKVAHKDTIASDRERTRQLARFGNNLNQLARWANGYKSAADAVRVITILKEIKGALNSY
jgi:antitoxin component of RelBE/YafQ-DinJ toxin-antitoxin module